MVRHMIAAAGAALVLAGGLALFWSIDLAGIERGTAFAVSGAVLLGSGVVTLALARVAALLERTASLATAAPARSADPPRSAAPAEATALAASMAAAALAQTGEPSAPAQPSGETATAEASTVQREEAKLTREVAKPAAPPRRAALARDEADVSKLPPSAPEDDDLEAALDAATTPANSAAAARWSSPPRLFPNDTPRPLEPPKPVEVRLAGRYQANGIDYSLFSDGSIETEQNGEKRRFSSLSELKAFIDQK
jgi:hypothetical protein